MRGKAFATVPPLLFALLWLPFPVAHAIVNLEDLHLGARQDGINGSAEASLSGSSGTTDKRDTSVGARVSWRHGPHDDILLLNHARGEALGVENTNRSFLHLRHIWQQRATLAWEGYLQGERDRFRRLSFRGLVGGGARFTLLEKTDEQAAYLGIGAMSERERFTALAGSSEETVETTTRANLYFVYKVSLRPGVNLANTIYVQPSLSDREDYQLFDTFALQVSLTDRLSLTLSIDVNHQSQPPTTITKTETVYRTGIGWRF